MTSLFSCLNSIENLWALLKAKMYRYYLELMIAPNTAYTKELLIKAVKNTWNNMANKLMDGLCEQMYFCCEAVIMADRWYTRY
jgi:hypothetical protein